MACTAYSMPQHGITGHLEPHPSMTVHQHQHVDSSLTEDNVHTGQDEVGHSHQIEKRSGGYAPQQPSDYSVPPAPQPAGGYGAPVPVPSYPAPQPAPAAYDAYPFPADYGYVDVEGTYGMSLSTIYPPPAYVTFYSRTCRLC